MLAAVFKEQITTDVYLGAFFYTLASMSIVLICVGLSMIDAGLIRAKNVLDNWVQKIVGSLVAAMAFIFVGYGIWNWQFYEAFGVKNAWDTAIDTWWLGGDLFRSFAININPSVQIEAEVFQVFALFFVTYAMVIAVFIHAAGIERLKAAPFYVMAAIAGGGLMPIMVYLTWGSASPLTNRGLHDYVGIFSLYMFIGIWALILAWRLGPRLGAFAPHPRTTGPRPHQMGLVGTGVMLLLFSIPFLVLGCGYLIPGLGYFGISGTTSGYGIAFTNVFMAYIGGAISGGLIAYKTRNAVFALLGPLSGYVSGTALFDIAIPWKVLVVAFFAPPLTYLTYVALRKLKIDEGKVVPVTLLPSIYGAIVAGFIGWKVDTGGYFGIDKGAYAFQHAIITPYWQLAGVGVSVGIALISGLIVIVGLEKTIGLRVSEEAELAGLDQAYWGMPPAPPEAVEEAPPRPAPAPTS